MLKILYIIVIVYLYKDIYKGAVKFRVQSYCGGEVASCKRTLQTKHLHRLPWVMRWLCVFMGDTPKMKAKCCRQLIITDSHDMSMTAQLPGMTSHVGFRSLYPNLFSLHPQIRVLIDPLPHSFILLQSKHVLNLALVLRMDWMLSSNDTNQSNTAHSVMRCIVLSGEPPALLLGLVVLVVSLRRIPRRSWSRGRCRRCCRWYCRCWCCSGDQAIIRQWQQLLLCHAVQNEARWNSILSPELGKVVHLVVDSHAATVPIIANLINLIWLYKVVFCHLLQSFFHFYPFLSILPWLSLSILQCDCQWLLACCKSSLQASLSVWCCISFWSFLCCRPSGILGLSCRDGHGPKSFSVSNC